MSNPSQLDRRVAVAALLRNRKDMLVVSGLGSPTYDLHATGDRDDNFYLWGAMGGAALIGLGLAQAQPGKRVLALTGDGEQLMGLGGIATIGVARPRNLDIVVIDNQHFGETGMQASHTGRGVDLTAIATACGFAATGTVRTLEEVQRLAAQMAEPVGGPRLFVIKVLAENPPRSLPSRDAVFIKNRFRAHLGFAAA
ncbi:MULTISPECIES: thiamine pyrophosphate-dependent enzyme [Bradyrhizobium]|uniref:thiamine pyrophosphate-dependent enzyme n=1 Tax=Bradyrhizobium TaxID=374 RepID=UPI000487914E|nr:MULTISPECIES: thiamine pyrophosphate-dependent enzyme [Bradyrhizobium]QOG17108.1 aldehyde dehydrogenase [Bradyrhizobium sp. SEMIA]UFW47958.1 thiamine pyrophosphate-dependent enzyme [Bradyrhizobium arachidis]